MNLPSANVQCPYCGEQIEMFVDTSVGNPTSWAWDVDSDGTVDYTTPAPQHTYPANGVYTCTLTVSNGWSTDTIAQEVNLGAGKLTTIFAANKVTGITSRQK